MRRSITLALALLGLPTMVAAQSVEDALRLSTESLPTGGRGLAMDGSIISAVKDYSALAINPAALAPLKKNEVYFAIWNRDHNSTASFLGIDQGANETSTNVSSVGAAFPVATTRGHFAVGISYDRTKDYSTSYKFSAVNPSSSFIDTRGFIQDPHTTLQGSARREYLDQNNLAWKLNLTRDVSDSGAENLTTIPFAGGLRQSGLVTEEGGMNALRLGAGIDIAENVSAGATVNFLFGQYDYVRNYSEDDVNGLYASNDLLHPLDFAKATITDSRHQDQTGVGLKVGLLAYPGDMFRFGLTIETPTYYHIDDIFSRSGNSAFRNGDQFSSGNDPSLTTTINSYSVTTPLRASAGASIQQFGATVAATVSYSDMRQIRFGNSEFDLSDLNNDARESLRGVFSWHLGAEYVIAPIGASLRAGYGVEPSSYLGDPTDYNTKTLSAGLGVLLAKSILLEASYRHIGYYTNHAIYNDQTVAGGAASANIDKDAVSRTDIAIGIDYRF
jgi:hypothetical protein